MPWNKLHPLDFFNFTLFVLNLAIIWHHLNGPL